MSSNVLSSTTSVIQAGDQMKGYLLGTKEQGPNGEESHGCYIVTLGSNPVFWRSGRQSTMTLSTAEAELNEIIEGMIAGEAAAVVAEEVMGPMARMLWSDSQSGLAILSNESGSWRTRHLRMRSTFAQAIVNGDWSIGHLPGNQSSFLTTTRGPQGKDDGKFKERPRSEERRRKRKE